MAEPDWLCPICALVKMTYGTTCKDDTCPNREFAHITGKHYLKPKESDSRSVGIAQISDEDA